MHSIIKCMEQALKSPDLFRVSQRESCQFLQATWSKMKFKQNVGHILHVTCVCWTKLNCPLGSQTDWGMNSNSHGVCRLRACLVYLEWICFSWESVPNEISSLWIRTRTIHVFYVSIRNGQHLISHDSHSQLAYFFQELSATS
jgi:hypothetical protein